MDHSNDLLPVKFKVYRSYTSKQLSSQPAKCGPQNSSEPSRVVRIYYTDSDATDSSSDNDESVEDINRRKIKKKYISVIKMGTFAEKLPENQNGVAESQKLGRSTRKIVKKIVPPNSPKYRGVWRRQSGKWAAEIRDSFDGRKIWLGVHNTAEEASYVYENAASQFKEAKALKNNLKTPSPGDISVQEVTVESGCSIGNEVRFSTSVIGDHDYKLAEDVALEDGTWALADFESCYSSKATPFVNEEMMSMVDMSCSNNESVSFDFANDINSFSWNVEDFFNNHVKMG